MGASIDGFNMTIDPRGVHWNYSIKISTQKTIGGKVIQLLGTNIGDLIINGQYGDHAVFRQNKFFERILKIADEQVPIIGQPAPKPVRFKWPEKNWDFWVYVKDLKQLGTDVAIERNVNHFSPEWRLVLFVYEDNGNIIKAIETSAQVKFLQRISAGMGWAQSDWNGPMTITEISETLAGRTVFEYLTTPLPFNEMYDEGPEVWEPETDEDTTTDTDDEED